MEGVRCHERSAAHRRLCGKRTESIVDVVLPRSDNDRGEVDGWARVREQPTGSLVDVRLRCLVDDPDDFKTCSADSVRVVE